MIRHLTVAVLAPAAALLIGCASSHHTRDLSECRLDGYSGFLQDYSRLEPSPTHVGAWYEQWTELPSYNAFIVDPIAMLAPMTSDGKPIPTEVGQELGAELRNEITEALRAGGFRIATEPGPGVARIRSAITELARSRRATGTDLRIGGAAAEMEIVDSLTERRVGAAVEHDEAVTFEVEPTRDPYSDAKLVFRHWAARFGLWLRNMHNND